MTAAYLLPILFYLKLQDSLSIQSGGRKVKDEIKGASGPFMAGGHWRSRSIQFRGSSWILVPRHIHAIVSTCPCIITASTSTIHCAFFGKAKMSQDLLKKDYVSRLPIFSTSILRVRIEFYVIITSPTPNMSAACTRLLVPIY